MKILLSIFLFLLCSVATYAADPLQITVTTDKTTVKAGETAQVTVVLKNPNPPLAPIVLQATASWEDVYGNKYTTLSNKVSIQVKRPMQVGTVGIPLDTSKLDYVANSAMLDGKPIAATQSAGIVNLTVNTSLAEWTKVTATFTVIGK